MFSVVVDLAVAAWAVVVAVVLVRRAEDVVEGVVVLVVDGTCVDEEVGDAVVVVDGIEVVDFCAARWVVPPLQAVTNRIKTSSGFDECRELVLLLIMVNTTFLSRCRISGRWLMHSQPRLRPSRKASLWEKRNEDLRELNHDLHDRSVLRSGD
ncbi:MAG TPA: hypothetical protein VHT30_10480 [Acidimicrobiales bacterium]|jgi:hypothetical protein|nr:hypothetical protein [Acidimicrobiales bacterium]